MIPNIWAVHREAKYGKHPDIFHPRRFLKNDGSGLIHKPDQLIPFSGGKLDALRNGMSNLQATITAAKTSLLRP